MPFTEDFNVFTDPAMFGAVGTYTPAGGVAVTVNGIFDRAYAESLPDIVEGARPVFQCAASDVPGITHGATLVIDGTTYIVRGVQPDGTGMVLLVLEEQ